jgi:uncharacterized protein (DUF934 family)
MAFFKNGAFAVDTWRRLKDGEDVPQDGGVILTLDQWSAHAPIHSSNVPVGLFIPAGTTLHTLNIDFSRFGVIALDFPKYVDGRAYSMAGQLRDDYHFTGELRATGDVLFDQLQLMIRCGFEAFDITDASTIKLLQEGRLASMSHFYQPAKGDEVPAGTRPWIRSLRA